MKTNESDVLCDVLPVTSKQHSHWLVLQWLLCVCWLGNDQTWTYIDKFIQILHTHYFGYFVEDIDSTQQLWH